MVEDELVLPYAKQGFLNDVYENARVLSEDYDGTGRIMKIRGLPGAGRAACERTPRCFPEFDRREKSALGRGSEIN